MATTFLDDLVTLLVGANIGLVYGVNLFKGPKAIFPAVGDGPFVSLIRSVGQGASGTHNMIDSAAYEQPGAQVVTRATFYDDAELMAQKVYEVLWPVRNRFINGTWWVNLSIKGEIFDLPIDEKGRPRIAFNLTCQKRTSPTTST